MKIIHAISAMVLFGVMMGVAMLPVAFADQHTAAVIIQQEPAAYDCHEPNGCYFMPDPVTISAGGEVTWTTSTNEPHMIIGGSPASGPNGTFDSMLIWLGDKFTYKFEEVGEYPYFCNVHPFLQGTVIVQEADAATDDGMADHHGEAVDGPEMSEPGGGCLVATAAYGTETAPQIQRLREIRDQNILSTGAGSSFIAAFNGIYYAFSPAVADMERENPLIKGAVLVAIQPILASLHIMEHADTESEVIVYGVLVILLNVAMYIAGPVLAVLWLPKAAAGRGGSRESLRRTAQAGRLAGRRAGVAGRAPALD